jgi:hypothetical protein
LLPVKTDIAKIVLEREITDILVEEDPLIEWRQILLSTTNNRDVLLQTVIQLSDVGLNLLKQIVQVMDCHDGNWTSNPHQQEINKDDPFI